MTFRLGGSSLPTFLDCEGRWAIQNVKVIKERHWAKPPKGIGSVFGTLAHQAGARMLQHVQDYNHTPDWRPYVVEAVEELRTIIATPPGVRMDPTTHNLDGAELQLERVIREFSLALVPTVRPHLIEFETGFTLAGDEWLQVVCHPDLLDHDGWLHDHKFSSKEGNYKPQAGSYLLSHEAAFYKPAKGFRINWIQRVGESSIQPDMRVIDYPKEDCVEAAAYAVKRVATVLKAWDSDKSEHKRNWHFRFNGSSKFCTQKTCGAWGTTFCNQWIDKEKAA